jgi:hypothetical protein
MRERTYIDNKINQTTESIFVHQDGSFDLFMTDVTINKCGVEDDSFNRGHVYGVWKHDPNQKVLLLESRKHYVMHSMGFKIIKKVEW